MKATPLVRARVCLSRGERCRVLFNGTEIDAIVRGVLDTPPITGDWALVRQIETGLALIEHVEPRRTHISRRAAGKFAREQLLAANVDVALIVCGLDGDFNPRRIERYQAIALEGGARPVVVLNKTDLRAELPQLPSIAVSALTGAGFDQLMSLLTPGITAVLLGSSGAGKSSILNRLLGHDRQQTNAVREHDSRGRHTTTHRELIELPSGASIIDTPGLREIQLIVSEDTLDAVFDEISALASQCHFADCRHESEPGCAVRSAVDPDRLLSFHKLQRESARNNSELRSKEKWRIATKAMRRLYQDREKW